MATTATRLITLIMLLQRQPNQTGSQLAQELGVSVRTIQRYITMLDEIGIPIYAERGPCGGYALVRGYKMPPLIFTPEEAVAVYLGASFLEEVWGRLYREAAQGALAKLDNLLPDEQRREVAWARQAVLSIGMNWTDPNLAAPYLEHLRDAIHERRRVRMRYRSRKEHELAERDVEPYKLVARWGRQYCIGYCHQRQAIRTFRLDRIATLELLDQTFAEPVDFNLQDYLAADPFFQPQVRVRLRFGPESTLAYGLNDSPVGLAAWLLSYASSGQKGKEEFKTRFSADEVLTNVMIYWATETINSAVRTYYANAHLVHGGAIEKSTAVRAAVAHCPYDPPLPREWAARQVNLVRFTDFPRGGHFMAWEEPELYVQDLQEFVRDLRP